MFTIMLLDIAGLISSPRCIGRWRSQSEASTGITLRSTSYDERSPLQWLLFQVCVILIFSSTEFGKSLRGRTI
jgi:hypothetical protein